MIPAASALLALRSNGTPIPGPALTKAGFATSVQLWSLKNFTLTEAIPMVAAAGAGAVELFPGQMIGGPHGEAKLTPDASDEVLAYVIDLLAKNHLAAANFGVTEIPANEAKARVIFEFAKKLGLYGVTTESLGAIDMLEKLAKEYDIKVCFHNHPKPTALWDPEKVWNAVKDRHENIGFCADVGHWATSGLDPLEVIKKVAPRVRSFHMKDREAVGRWTHDRPFGTGVINIIAILSEVRKHGFAGNVSIEYEHNWATSLPEIAQCTGYLRAYAAMASMFEFPLNR